MTMEFWFIAALIPILSAAVVCYVIFRLLWSGLRGLRTLLGLGSDRHPRSARPSTRREVPVRIARAGERRVCAAEDCQHLNATHARFCALCGRRLLER